MLARTGGGKTKAMALLAAGMALLALAACQFIAGTESREANPLHGGCTLPSGKGPQVRIANFVPNADVVDVCIRPAGGSWGEPIILNGGTACATTAFFGSSESTAGFAYGQVSIPFTAPAQTVDVKMVAAGNDCNDAALTQASGLKLSAQAVTTLLRIGGAAGVAETIEALPENYPANTTGVNLRLVHAMPGVGPLDIGLAPPGITQLPTTVASLILQDPIAFGHVAPTGERALTGNLVTSSGYIPISDGAFYVVAGVHGTSPEKAVILEQLPSLNGAEYSLYAAGLPRDDQHPQQGYFCNEGAMPMLQSNPLLVQCAKTHLSGISVDVLNTSLYGPNAPVYAARKMAITDPQNSPIQKRDSDIMCLTELEFVSDIQQLVANAQPPDAGGTGSFPYSYWVQTNEQTPFTSAATQDGSVPPAPTAPPCGNVPASDVTQAYQCMIQNCSSNPGMATGTLPGSTDCLTKNCAGYLGPLLFNSSYNACFDCIIDYAASDQPYATGQTACTMTPQQPFGFGGQLPNLILSRYPLSDSDYYLLPSTNYRQGVLYSKVHLEDQTVDFYCGFLTSTLVASVLPYTGNYGAGGNPTSEVSGGAYANEQLWQAQDLINWVKQKSGSNPAIIVGDWRSSAGSPPDAGVLTPEAGLFTPPTEIVPETLNLLGSVFQTVSAPTWIPQCNYCPQSDNSLNQGQTQGYFMTQPFLYNWPSDAVQEESLLYTQPTPAVLFNDASAPITQYFGLNVQIIRPK